MARMIDADRLLRELTALSHGQVWPGWTYDGIRLLIERQPTLTQPNEPTYPCDLCVYNPPSSLGGKPCTFCPATGRPPEGEEET